MAFDDEPHSLPPFLERRLLSLADEVSPPIRLHGWFASVKVVGRVSVSNCGIPSFQKEWKYGWWNGYHRRWPLKVQECSLSEAMGKDTGVAIFMATWSALERVHFGAPQNFLTSQQAVSGSMSVLNFPIIFWTYWILMFVDSVVPSHQ